MDDATMERLAGALADEFIDVFFDSLEMLAERFDLPKRMFPDALE